MISPRLRPALARVVDPIAARLLASGVTPDAVTLAGTVGVVAASLGLLSRGEFLVGTILVVLSALTDMLDGAMARRRGPSRFGAWLDSSCDRAADAAIFAALVIWYSGRDDLLVAVALYCLVSGSVVSYVKARAEGLGMTCNVGVAERAERLIIVLTGTGFAALGVPELLAAALWLLAVLSTVTVGQRFAEVRRQAALPPP